MSLDQAIRGRLGETALLTNITAQRIYPEARAQGGALPCVVYGIQDEQRIGGLAASAGVAKAKVEVNLLATSRLTARAMEMGVVAALEYWSGTAAGAGYSVSIQSSTHHSTMTGYMEPPAGESSGTFVSTMIFTIFYGA